ncbi:MAG: hypothetical protein KJ902_00695 [Candidatus Omnitrophica bacterium]|nr:hypothetical protein [Candidatus Omnitrophota bacterium]
MNKLRHTIWILAIATVAMACLLQETSFEASRISISIGSFFSVILSRK